MKRLLALILLTLPLLAHEPSAVTTVILVRHGEKASDSMSNDPQLSASGAARAEELARVLSGTKIDAIYSTAFARTRNTAAPLAAKSGVKTVEVTAGKTYAAEMAAIVREKHKGQTVVVVGHSNTTPDVIRELGVANPPAIPDSQYDDLFIVTIGSGIEPKLVSLRYGAVTR